MIAETASGETVLFGQAADVRIRDTPTSVTLDLEQAHLQTLKRPIQSFKAERMWIHAESNEDSPLRGRLKFELMNAACELTTGVDSSLLRAKKVELLIDSTSFGVEQVQAKGVDSLRSTSTHRGSAQIESSRRISAARAKTLAALEQPVDVSFSNISLNEAMTSLRRKYDLNIVLHETDLANVGATPQTLVSVELSGVSLRTVFESLLDPLNLGMRIDGEGVIRIVSRALVLGEPVVIAYPVADLVVPIPQKVTVQAAATAGSPQPWPLTPATSVSKRKSAKSSDRSDANQKSAAMQVISSPMTNLTLDELAELLKQIVSPDSWQEVGGLGSIRAFDTTLTLVVRQTPSVHDEIRDLLEQLRRLQDITVGLQVESFAVSAAVLQKKTPDLEFELVSGSTNQTIARLTKSQESLIRTFSEVQQLPKISLFNGHRCDVLLPRCEGLQPRLSLQPVVSSDRRFIRLSLGVDDARSEIDDEQLAVVPAIQDGESILVKLSDSKADPDAQDYLLIHAALCIAEEELLGFRVPCAPRLPPRQLTPQ